MAMKASHTLEFVGDSASVSSQRRSPARRFCSWLLSFMLVFSLAPISSLAYAADLDASGAAASSAKDETLSNEAIDQMLAAGPYEEGSALVVVDNAVAARNDGARARGADILDSAEPLMDASAGTLEQAIESETGNGQSASMLRSNGDAEGAATIKLVTQAGMSTEQLLEALRDDPRVIVAEPNYTYSLVDPDETSSIDISSSIDGASSSAAPSDSSLAAGDAADLTAFQWAYSADADVLKVAGKTASYDMNVPLWVANRTDSSVANATGTVAVVDTGIDYEHPDLASVMRDDMRTFVDYGSDCGYAPAQSTTGEGPMDDQGHGTHVAGIIGAEWNDEGVSGIASGIKLVAVKAGNVDGKFGMDDVIKGYAYLADAVRGGLDDLVSINNSWGGASTTYSLMLAVTELGRLGTISVFASGNESLNTDNSAQTVSSLRSNPYVVVVNSATRYSERSSFSNYGVATTDVFAAGSSILSTFPQDKSSYFPEAYDANLMFESFTDADPAAANVHVSSDGAFGSADGTVQGDAQFDETGGALNVGLSDLASISPAELNAYVSVNVGTSDASAVQNFGWRYYTDGSPSVAAGVYVRAVDESGAEDWVFVNATTAGRSVAGDWFTESFNIAEACTAVEMTPKMENDSFMLLIRLLAPQEDWDLSKSFYLDTVGVAPSGSEVAYAYQSGTSMATPAVAGEAAIAALNDDPALSPAERAEQRAMRLRSSVTPVVSMADLCASRGVADLSVLDTASMVPVVLDATVETGSDDAPVIAITGGFYGSAWGSATIGGVAATVMSWSDDRIVVECPTGISSGVLVVKVENAAGKVGQRAIALELPVPPADEATPLYEREYELPALSEVPAEAMDQALIAGLGGKLYLLPRSTQSDSATQLWALDLSTGEWERCADLPTEVVSPTMVAYEKTMIVGGTFENSAGDIVSSLLQFDPATGSWSTIDVALPQQSTLANVEGTLLAVGGMVGNGNEYHEIDEVLSVDVKTKETKLVGRLETPLMSPDVSASGTTLTVGRGLATNTQGQIEAVNGFALYAYKDGQLTGGDDVSALPDFGTSAPNPYALAVVRDGVASVGFSAVEAGGSGALEDEDTYLLNVPSAGEDSVGLMEASTFAGFGKRFMRGQVYNQAVAAYDGQLYAIGYLNGGADGWVLRSTAVATYPAAGDVIHGGDDPTPTPEPTPLPGPSENSLVRTGDDVLPFVSFVTGAMLLAMSGAAVALRKLGSR